MWNKFPEITPYGNDPRKLVVFKDGELVGWGVRAWHTDGYWLINGEKSIEIVTHWCDRPILPDEQIMRLIGIMDVQKLHDFYAVSTAPSAPPLAESGQNQDDKK